MGIVMSYDMSHIKPYIKMLSMVLKNGNDDLIRLSTMEVDFANLKWYERAMIVNYGVQMYQQKRIRITHAFANSINNNPNIIRIEDA